MPMNLVSLQQPLVMIASLLTGKDVGAILALEVHERVVLLDECLLAVKELTAVMRAATDPASESGVTLSESEVAAIVAEADDVPQAVRDLTGYRSV